MVQGGTRAWLGAGSGFLGILVWKLCVFVRCRVCVCVHIMAVYCICVHWRQSHYSVVLCYRELTGKCVTKLYYEDLLSVCLSS